MRLRTDGGAQRGQPRGGPLRGVRFGGLPEVLLHTARSLQIPRGGGKLDDVRIG